MPANTNTATTTCTGDVLRMTTHEGVTVDGESYRSVTVHLTRCTGCHGTAQVVEDDGLRLNVWNGIELPGWATDDTEAAYFAAAATVYNHPDQVTEHYPAAEVDGEVWDDDQECEYLDDEDGSEAFARMLERRAEQGTWWGR